MRSCPQSRVMVVLYYLSIGREEFSDLFFGFAEEFSVCFHMRGPDSEAPSDEEVPRPVCHLHHSRRRMEYWA